MSEITPKSLTQFIVKQGQVMANRSAPPVRAEQCAGGDSHAHLAGGTDWRPDPAHRRPRASMGNRFSPKRQKSRGLFIVGEQRLGERADTEKALLEALTGTPQEGVNESHFPAVQEFFQHLMQGLAVAFGNLRNTTFTPGEVTVKYEPVTFRRTS